MKLDSFVSLLLCTDDYNISVLVTCCSSVPIRSVCPKYSSWGKLYVILNTLIFFSINFARVVFIKKNDNRRYTDFCACYVHFMRTAWREVSGYSRSLPSMTYYFRSLPSHHLFCWMLHLCRDNDALIQMRTSKLVKRKRKRSDSVLWHKPLHPQKNSKSNVTTQKRHRLRRVSWSYDRQPTGVVKSVYGIKTFPLTENAA